MTGQPGDQVATLAARVAYLERERRAVFEDAQREADAVFAQYQLSQLLASGEPLEPLAAAVLVEVALATGASGAALWLLEPPGRRLLLVASSGEGLPDLPGFDRVAQAARWVTRHGWAGTPLEGSLDPGSPEAEPAAVGYLAIRPPDGSALDPGHVRYLALIRRELAITFQAAQLRTSLTQERATLAAILEGASDGIVAVDADRRVVELNLAAARLLRMDRRRAVGGRCVDVLGCDIGSGDVGSSGGMAPELRCGAECPFAEVLESGRPLAARERSVRARDRTLIPVAASYAPTSGGAVRAVAVIRDLRPGLALDQMTSSFVASVTHELRTPLALIRGHAQSLLHLDLDATESRRHLERIEEAVGRLSELVDSILDTSLLESDRLPLHRSPVDLDQLIRSFSTEVRSLAEDLPLTVSVDRDLPLVDADPTRIRQVLSNLVANSAKYAGHGSRIRIGARRLDARIVVVTVADDGVGIDAAERDHIFDRFYRGRAVRESRISGSGLGLYLCRRLVESHGGWIRLDATLRGTSISFGLPIASDA